MRLATEIRRRIKGDVYDDQKTLARFSMDASLFEVMPALVVAPKDREDLKTLVHLAREMGFSLTARAGGTGMDGGALSESVVLDFTKYFNRVHEVRSNPGDGGVPRARVEPGVFYRDFEKQTLAENLLLPSFPASREICTVGGMVANNSGGELTLKYGKTERYVRRLSVILSDGNEYTLEPLHAEELREKLQEKSFEGDVYRNMHALIRDHSALIERARPRVSKNSAGYALWNVWDAEREVFDLTKLFVGSQGTLGLITDIEFKLIEPKAHSQMVIFFLNDLSKLDQIVDTVLQHKPTTFESYDDKTLRLALRFGWSLFRRLGIVTMLYLIAHSIPEALAVLRSGFPKLVLQITFEGNDRGLLEEKGETLVRDMKQYRPSYSEVLGTETEAAGYLRIRRESFNLLRHKVKGMRAAPFIDDVCVDPGVLPQFLPRLDMILAPYKKYMVYNIAGHVGDGNFHIIPLMDLSNKDARAIIPTLMEEVYDLVVEYGGSITGEHNDGILRTPFLDKQFGKEVMALFKETKRIFDPRGIFNPGKKVNGDLGYLLSHLKTK